jgi:hypothetical protein
LRDVCVLHDKQRRDLFGAPRAMVGEPGMRLHSVDRTGNLQALFGQPALQPLIAQVVITVGNPHSCFDATAPAPGQILVAPSLGERAGARLLLRFALEQAWMSGVPGVPPEAAVLLAARAAACAMKLAPQADQLAALEDPALPGFLRLTKRDPDAADLLFAWRHVVGTPPDPASLALAQRLWRFAEPLEALLTGGGDDRLTLDPETGRNRYLCAPYPEPDVIALGSCTASSPTQAAFEAAEHSRQALFAAAVAHGGRAALRGFARDTTAALLDYFGVADLADAVLAASGTDATLLLTGLIAAEHPGRGIETVLMSPSETGSGVPDAVRGQHFAPCTASGQLVEKGGAVDGFPPGLALTIVRLRTPEGEPLEPAELAVACETAIEAAVGRGSQVVLHAIDGSKTGLMGPDRATCQRLAGRFGARLDVVIDACQARIEPAIMRWYLERGFPVLVTGSKFFGAPGFCGAILFPRARLRRITGGGQLPDGLGAYADLTEDGVSRRCPGLLLRWAAALEEMRRFAAVPVEARQAALDGLGTQTRAAIMRDARLRLIHAPRPAGAGWSDRPSVFTFAVRGDAGWMSAAALRPLYVALSQSLPGAKLLGQCCRIGQPVEVAPGLGGLRIAFSAAQVATGADQAAALATVFGKLNMLLDSGAPFA